MLIKKLQCLCVSFKAELTLSTPGKEIGSSTDLVILGDFWNFRISKV